MQKAPLKIYLRIELNERVDSDYTIKIISHLFYFSTGKFEIVVTLVF